MIRSEGTYFGQPAVLICDGNCSKAWGINNRPQIYLSCNEDDHAYFADQELGTAPANPGTYEGGQGKPALPPEFHNKWCARECERCRMIDPGKSEHLRDFSKREYNISDSALRAANGTDYMVSWDKDGESGVFYVNAETEAQARIIAAWYVGLYTSLNGANWRIRVLYPDDTIIDEAVDYAEK